jgi:hypothetical protein
MPFLGQGFLSIGMYQDIAYALQGGIAYTFTIQSPDAAVFDLDLFDQNANKVDTSPVMGSLAQCEVTPLWSGPFTLRILCRQGEGRFVLASNPYDTTDSTRAPHLKTPLCNQ